MSDPRDPWFYRAWMDESEADGDEDQAHEPDVPSPLSFEDLPDR